MNVLRIQTAPENFLHGEATGVPKTGVPPTYVPNIFVIGDNGTHWVRQWYPSYILD